MKFDARLRVIATITVRDVEGATEREVAENAKAGLMEKLAADELDVDVESVSMEPMSKKGARGGAVPAAEDPEGRFDCVGTGWIPCNAKPWRDAEVVLFRPGYGMICVSFAGKGRVRKTEEVVARVYWSDRVCRSSESGVSFAGDADEIRLLFNTCAGKGDIRKTLRAALSVAGWPTSPRSYYLAWKSGSFAGLDSPETVLGIGASK